MPGNHPGVLLILKWQQVQLKKNKILKTPAIDGDEILISTRPPTKTEVLKCKLKLTEKGLDSNEANKEIINQIKNIYINEGIETVSDQTMECHIDKYFKEYCDIKNMLVGTKAENHLKLGEKNFGKMEKM